MDENHQSYHCFGCGAGGNVISFVMEYEKLDFVEAVESIANDISFDLEYEENSSDFYKKTSNKTNKSIYDYFELINNFFIENLNNNNEQKEYLLKRGLTEKTIKEFKIGLATSSYEFMNFLKSKNISFQIATEMGLLSNDENNKIYARFSNRITFPIFSQSNKIIAFGGRTTKNHPAKYINSPQTKYFDKSKTLYGLNIAKKEIHKTKSLIVVEGYLDLIALNQAEIKNSVATLGTALTESHLSLLKRENTKIILIFDGDQAGINAMLKAVSLLSSVGIETLTVIIPNNLDPADLIFNNKTEYFQELLNNPKDAILYSIEFILSKFNLSNPFEKNSARNEINNFLEKLSPFLKQEYFKKILDKFSIDLTIENKRKFDFNLKKANFDKKNNYQNDTKNIILSETIQKTIEKNNKKRLFSSDSEYILLYSAINDEMARKYFLESSLISTRYKKSKIPELLKNKKFDSPELSQVQNSCPEYLKNTISGDFYKRELIIFEIRYLRKLVNKQKEENLKVIEFKLQIKKLQQELRNLKTTNI